MSYVQLEDVKAFLEIDPEDEAQAAFLELCIASADEHVDKFCGRSFTSETATRYYAPSHNRRSVTDLDDLASVEALVVAVDTDLDGTYGTTLTIGQDFVVPNRRTSTEPYTELRTRGSYWFPRDPYDHSTQTIKVTGTFGWPEVPASVQEASLYMTARFWKRAQSPSGVGGYVGASGDFQISWSDPDVLRLLKPFQRLSRWLA